jgi:uncharacterized protein (TIGR00730 family)
METKIQSLTVFCAARPGEDPDHMNLAYQLGRWLAQKNIQLVYGGGSLGLMGALARGCHENGGYVIGVIPEALKERELEFKQAQELIVVKSMHERKAQMNLRGQAFLTLPGGFGTLEEVFEVITWKQLNFHNKPIYFLNYKNYFTKLFEFINHMKLEKFISEEDVSRVHIFETLPDWEKHWQK